MSSGWRLHLAMHRGAMLRQYPWIESRHFCFLFSPSENSSRSIFQQTGNQDHRVLHPRFWHLWVVFPWSSLLNSWNFPFWFHLQAQNLERYLNFWEFRKCLIILLFEFGVYFTLVSERNFYDYFSWQLIHCYFMTQLKVNFYGYLHMTLFTSLLDSVIKKY